MLYIIQVFENFKDDVHYWLTNNEYNVMIYYGAIDMMTGKANDLNALYNTGHIQLVYMAKAISLCHELCPDAKIGPAPNLCACYPATANPKDIHYAMNYAQMPKLVPLQTYVHVIQQPQIQKIQLRR